MPAPDASSIWRRNYPNAVHAIYHKNNLIISIKALRSSNFSGLKLRSPLSNAHVPNMIYYVLQHIIMMQIVSILARANSGRFRIFHTNHYILFHHSITKQGRRPYLYFPLASERGLKSAITPDGGGDAKINQTSFLLEPESVENLHNNRGVRNFWVRVRDAGVFSARGASDMQQARKFTPEEETVTLSAGFMWHSVRRTVKDYGVESTVTTFIPWDSNVEIIQ